MQPFWFVNSKRFEHTVRFSWLLFGLLSQKWLTFKLASQLPIPYPDTYLKSYLTLTLMLGRFLSGFFDAFFERKWLVQRFSWRKWRAGHCSFSAAEKMGGKVRPLHILLVKPKFVITLEEIPFAKLTLLFCFPISYYSAHILTSFLTGRITIPWVFLGSELTKTEISWILEQKRLFKKGSWQGIFAQDFMSREWISILTLSLTPSTYLK